MNAVLAHFFDHCNHNFEMFREHCGEIAKDMGADVPTTEDDVHALWKLCAEARSILVKSPLAKMKRWISFVRSATHNLKELRLKRMLLLYFLNISRAKA